MKQQTAIELIDRFIDDDGYKSYESLPDDSKELLTGLAIIEAGNDGYEALVECAGAHDNVTALANYLMTGDDDGHYFLLKTLRANAVSYHAPHLAELYADRFRDIDCQRKNDAGLYPITDCINGEVRWVR